ncbi:hypothetical protein WJX72_008990 [[Myrmecia] bisecta]|uniref:glycerophosphodiester phosphodiesterase n=1 Tax=[Myrmecia] bisecta TaxID=41462 RepID=A0AAW1P3I8_9CHLO
MLPYPHVEAAKPLIIAHRGSPCSIPEETLAGYQQAIDDGANFVEMDVIASKDGQLVCRHDLTLDDSTNVEQVSEFADRRSTHTLPDGRNQTGFFVSDFTLAEIQTLYARQAMPFRDQSTTALLRVPSLDEVLQLVVRNGQQGKHVGVYIETKGPSFHDSIGMPLERPLVQALLRAGFLDITKIPVILQSFESQSLEKMSLELKALRKPALPLVWLLGCDSNVTDAELDEFATFGTHIGPDKDLLAPVDWTPECSRPAEAPKCAFQSGQQCIGRLQTPPGSHPPGGKAAQQAQRAQQAGSLVQRAHQRGLQVHAFTFRNEGMFMAIDFRSDPFAELSYFAGPEGLGVDGVLVDGPATAHNWVQYINGAGADQRPATFVNHNDPASANATNTWP